MAIWPLKNKAEKILKTTEIDFWLKNEKTTNNIRRETMGVTHTIKVDYVRDKQFICFEHIRRI